MKNILIKSTLVVLTLGMTAAAQANPRAAMMIGFPDVAAIDNPQEKAAADYFVKTNSDGGIITPGETAKINKSSYDCIWIHIDRLNVGKGNLPEAFSDNATVNALKQFVEDGGNLLLTKHATQLVSRIGRISETLAPNIYGDGDGALGSDVWTIQSHIGLDNIENDPSQYYDHSSHQIYAGLTIWPAQSEQFGKYDSDTYAMEGTGNGTDMWREDHNCCWDLNAYQYASDGKNTVEKFENENNAVVLGTWGHVKDYAVAGIVEFLPQAATRANALSGRIIANGLAACEWAPRQGVNAYQQDLEKLTDNCLAYLTPNVSSVIEEISVADTAAPVEYYNLQGMSVKANALTPGVYVTHQGNKVAKILVK